MENVSYYLEIYIFNHQEDWEYLYYYAMSLYLLHDTTKTFHGNISCLTRKLLIQRKLSCGSLHLCGTSGV